MAEGGPGTTGDVVAALRAVDGVADASITPDERSGGAGTLHLSLEPGADEVAVATSVNRILREHFSLAVDTDNVSVVDETIPVRLAAVPPIPEEPVQQLSRFLDEPAEDEALQPIEASVRRDPWSSYRPEQYGSELPLEAEAQARIEGQAQAESQDRIETVDDISGQGGGVEAQPWWAGAADPGPAEPGSAETPVPERVRGADITLLPTRPREPEVPDPAPSWDDLVAEITGERRVQPQQGDDSIDVTDGGDESRDQALEVEGGTRPRLLIERMQLVAADLGVETEVTLAFGSERWTGRADAAATPTSVHRSVAVATLRAVGKCVGSSVRLELEHLETPPLGVDRAVVVEISMVTRRGAERLTGVSAIREDVRQAVIRATLDAVNRRLETQLLSV